MAKNINFILAITLLSLLYLGASLYSDHQVQLENVSAVHPKLDASVLRHWHSRFADLLDEPLWTPVNIYDAGHYLMVPLHTAFYFNNRKIIKDFSRQFENFMNFLNGRGLAFTGAGTQNNSQYAYLASRYLYLAHAFGYQDYVPNGLFKVLEDFVLDYSKKPGTWWKNQERAMTLDERYTFIMSDEATDFQYYKVIPDLHLFLSAIAADLVSVARKADMQTCRINELEYIVRRTYDLLKHEIVFLGQNDRWLLQPGVWSDHRDYSYAGHNKVFEDMQPKPIPDIAIDSSHFHRFPLFLISWQTAFNPASAEYKYFEKLRSGLVEQMITAVIMPPIREASFYRLTNYMDGRNGVYRFNYVTNAEQKGTLPYQLSGTFLLGWWAFLSDSSISQIYKEIFDSFPLSKKAIECYTGANTTRERNPIFYAPGCYHDKGIIKIITYFAYKIGGATLKSNNTKYNAEFNYNERK